MKIAVIGSGISGLTAAHLLARSHAVTLFEGQNRLGGHTHTVEVPWEHQKKTTTYAIDTGFIVFNDWTYPNFMCLMNSLGVTWQDSTMSLSIQSEQLGIEYNGADLDRLFIQRRNLLKPRYVRMLLEILRFNREAPKILRRNPSDPIDPRTLGQYLKDEKYSSWFQDLYVLPMGGAIWSAPSRMMLEFPASKFVDFFYNHGMLSVDDRPVWKVLKGGSRSYLPLITQPFRDSIRLQSPVQRVKRLKDAVEVSTPMGTERFDHIVFASHADETLQILRESNDLMPGEEALLSAIPYQENDTILHTDSSVLPKNPRAWAAWNTFLPKEANRKVAITYLMNHLQGFDAPVNFCVSLNLSDRIDPKTVLRRLTYHHPIFTTEGVRAQAEWNSISRMDRRTHFCGAYWFHGFHEDGVRSGLRVAETFGETLEGASWQRSTRH